MCSNFCGFRCSSPERIDLCKCSYITLKQVCTHIKSNIDVISSSSRQNCQDFCFIVLDIGLALTSAQAKNVAIDLAITLERTSLRFDAVENYTFLVDPRLVQEVGL